ncbi:MAG: YhjD/YihY/BrkB family envelope integrity protein [Spirochaetota bacterium]|nr:YhjD/YihY/BrkB family envelope integrity protein [Spirochaetota bacterium]
MTKKGLQIETLKRAAGEVRIFFHRVAREFLLDSCMLRASSLAFSTLLALVPLTAFIFSLFTGFGAFEDVKIQLQQFVIDFLVPTRTKEVMFYIERFIDNTRTLGVVGLLFFAFTSMILLNGISTNINSIWGSTSRRGFVRKFLMYMAVIVLSTLLIGASFTFTHTIRRIVENFPDISALLRVLVRLAPSLFVFITIWLITYAVPSAKVNLLSSLIGAAAGTVLWDIARFIFIDGTNYMIRLSVIYGSIAAIPIFLIWLSIIWSIIFFSSEITYVHQHRHLWWREQHGDHMPPRQQVLMGLQIFLYIARNFYSGKKPPQIKTLADHFSITTNLVEFFTGQLETGGLVFKSPNANPHLLPQKGLSRTSVGEVLDILYGRQVAAGGNISYTEARNIVQQAIQTGRRQFDQLTVLQLIETIEKKAPEG